MRATGEVPSFADPLYFRVLSQLCSPQPKVFYCTFHISHAPKCRKWERSPSHAITPHYFPCIRLRVHGGMRGRGGGTLSKQPWEIQTGCESSSAINKCIHSFKAIPVQIKSLQEPNGGERHISAGLSPLPLHRRPQDQELARPDGALPAR